MQMKTLIVYDSYFGNTEKIAEAVGGALAQQNEVSLVRVSEVKPDQLQGIQLLAVGSPTRAFRPSDGTRAFLRELAPGSLNGVSVAAFDTRINPADTNSGFLRFMVRLFGYAAQPIAKDLQKKGGRLVGQPAGFEVKESEGPLKDGELERAASWASSLI